jgi:hypothetical protein
VHYVFDKILIPSLLLLTCSFSCYAYTGQETMTPVRYHLASWMSKTLSPAHCAHAPVCCCGKESFVNLLYWQLRVAPWLFQVFH